ncbi:MAG TPA: hypothetical protein VK138_06330 [Acidiferrobacterales bacterium]|nr:hypothetical protein [Acidiferrobacterales bacterium]
MNADLKREPGVYSADGDPSRLVDSFLPSRLVDSFLLVHHYQGGEYHLADIVACFELGRLEKDKGTGETQLVLDAREIHLLKTMADAYSFDYEEGFIEMCLEIHQFAAGLPHESFCFTANF